MRVIPLTYYTELSQTKHKLQMSSGISYITDRYTTKCKVILTHDTSKVNNLQNLTMEDLKHLHGAGTKHTEV
jgi:hypothetical protein